jgi:hypothetical protein
MATRWLAGLKFAVLPVVGVAVVRLLRCTMRLERLGGEGAARLSAEGRHVIYAFWHAQQLMMPFAYRGRGAHVLISRHRDGELIQRIASRFGFEAVRGSSTRGGATALRQLIRLGRLGSDLIVTPDGPKGPRQVAKMGVIQLAKATEMPIVPVAFACSKKKLSRVGTGFSSPIRSVAGSTC